MRKIIIFVWCEWRTYFYSELYGFCVAANSFFRLTEHTWWSMAFALVQTVLRLTIWPIETTNLEFTHFPISFQFRTRINFSFQMNNFRYADGFFRVDARHVRLMTAFFSLSRFLLVVKWGKSEVENKQSGNLCAFQRDKCKRSNFSIRFSSVRNTVISVGTSCLALGAELISALPAKMAKKIKWTQLNRCCAKFGRTANTCSIWKIFEKWYSRHGMACTMCLFVCLFARLQLQPPTRALLCVWYVSHLPYR